MLLLGAFAGQAMSCTSREPPGASSDAQGVDGHLHPNICTSWSSPKLAPIFIGHSSPPLCQDEQVFLYNHHELPYTHQHADKCPRAICVCRVSHSRSFWQKFCVVGGMMTLTQPLGIFCLTPRLGFVSKD